MHQEVPHNDGEEEALHPTLEGNDRMDMEMVKKECFHALLL